jgi:hypothetical protein
MNLFRHKFSSEEPSILQTRWFAPLLSFCIMLLIVAGFVEFYRRAEPYASREIRNDFGRSGGHEKIPLFCQLMNKPAWLAPAITEQLFAETQNFARHDQSTYDRLQDPLDQDILRQIADNYTGIDATGVNHRALRDNAWIKKITEVRRVIAPDRKSQTIEIYAEYRQPAAWVLHGGKCYLIDDEFTRLPLEYTDADRKKMPAWMAIRGTSLPEGMTKAPEPGESWDTPDLEAGMKLIDLLQASPQARMFLSQIDSIDVSNFHGRKDPGQPQLVLDTIWPSSADPTKPRIIQWGRPVGEEKFFDISAAAKIRTLSKIDLLYHRIDAGADFVDIHTEQVWIPQNNGSPAGSPSDAGAASPTTPRG